MMEQRSGSPTTQALAGELYTIYCAAVGGVAFNGEPLPDWEAFRADPAKGKQVNGWLALAGNVELIANQRHALPEGNHFVVSVRPGEGTRYLAGMPDLARLIECLVKSCIGIWTAGPIPEVRVTAR